MWNKKIKKRGKVKADILKLALIKNYYFLIKTLC